MSSKRKIIRYNPDLKKLASQLRKNMTLSEVLLWNELKQKKMLGFDFDRQRPIDEYIVDFYCKELQLAIEIDGDTHIYKYDYDEERQKSLERLGIHFLRFEDIEVKKNINNVLRVITNWIERNRPTPGPSGEGNFVGDSPGTSGEGNFVGGTSNFPMEGKPKKPTPGPSREGNFVGETSDPYRKGNFVGETSDPYRKGNFVGDSPGTSGEGNLEESTPELYSDGNIKRKDLRTKKKPTPGPSRDGNFKKYTSDTTREGILDKSSSFLIGSVAIGGNNPVRIQSMTNTNTLDTKASVSQCIRIIEAGSDFVRLTAQGVREAGNLRNIKKALRKAGFETPLIADIHFNPQAAETAAGIVEKVRINPGNYADKRASFIKTEFSEKEYSEELERIHTRLLPLITICNENGTAVRIGVNHGSLSDRIMTRYGNTPEGMAVSAMEFIRIFRAENFHKLVISMKSSDTAVMILATLAIGEMMKGEGFYYPLHLGVTESGEGEDGRIRSAAGIGALLSEGIGDTIRVSLSEAPENEIPVAKEILRVIAGDKGRISAPANQIKFRQREALYKPEVVSRVNGVLINEDGSRCKDRIVSVSPVAQIPEITDAGKEKIIIRGEFEEEDTEKLAIDSASLMGKYFITKQADGICIDNSGDIKMERLKELSFSILQATEARITKVIYLSCPTCGRTKFNLQEAVKEVKAATAHLKGLKIAVMGCIVNGPGEMAGADYGYVGAGEGKVHIYRGMIPVLKNVPQENAAEELLRIIEKDLIAN